MKSSEGSYLLSELKWAIAPEAGIVHPFLCMQDKGLYYDLFTHNMLAYNHGAEHQYSRHYNNVVFECLSTELLYCVKIKTSERLSGEFLKLPDYDIRNEAYLEFVGEVHRLCQDLYVSDADLWTFAKEIKQTLAIPAESIAYVSCGDDPLYIPYQERRRNKKII